MLACCVLPASLGSSHTTAPRRGWASHPSETSSAMQELNWWNFLMCIITITCLCLCACLHMHAKAGLVGIHVKCVTDGFIFIFAWSQSKKVTNLSFLFHLLCLFKSGYLILLLLSICNHNSSVTARTCVCTEQRCSPISSHWGVSKACEVLR